MDNNKVVTREEFEAFLQNQNGEGPPFNILRDIPDTQRQLLFDVGNAVCNIHYVDDEGGNYYGSGFHLGGGWIMTNLHVISDEETLEAEHLSKSTFHFPTKPLINAASRCCIFSIVSPDLKVCVKALPSYLKVHVEALPPDLKLDVEALTPDLKVHVEALSPDLQLRVKDLPPDSKVHVKALPQDLKLHVNYLPPHLKIHVKDIALIYVPEVIDLAVPCLIHPSQGPPNSGDCVHLVYFENGRQQFSVNGSINPDHIEGLDVEDYSFSRFNAYSPEGSSGAPLVRYSEERNTFVVVGLQYEGPEDAEQGKALWFSGKYWLNSTLHAAFDIAAEGRITSSAPEIIHSYIDSVCKGLEKQLKEHQLRVILNRPRPEFVTGVFEHVTFRP